MRTVRRYAQQGKIRRGMKVGVGPVICNWSLEMLSKPVEF